MFIIKRVFIKPAVHAEKIEKESFYKEIDVI